MLMRGKTSKRITSHAHYTTRYFQVLRPYIFRCRHRYSFGSPPIDREPFLADLNHKSAYSFWVRLFFPVLRRREPCKPTSTRKHCHGAVYPHVENAKDVENAAKLVFRQVLGIERMPIKKLPAASRGEERSCIRYTRSQSVRTCCKPTRDPSWQSSIPSNSREM